MKVIHWTESSHYFLRFLVEAQQKVGIDSINTSLADVDQNGNYDIVHIHWPEDCVFKYKDLADFLDTLDSIKSAGTKVVMTLHNEKPHIGNGEELYREVFMRLDGLIHLGSHSFNIYKKKFHFKQTIIPLGLFEYLNNTSRDESRLKLNIPDNKKVVLVFGTIRKFYEFKKILKAFRHSWKRNSSLILLICNARNMQLPSIRKETLRRIESIYLLQLAKLHPSIILYGKPISDYEVQYFFHACDTVLLLRDSLNSGIPYVAKFFHKPIIGPDVGNIQECIKDFNGYLYNRSDPKTISELIMTSLGDRREQVQNFVESKYSWITSAKKHNDFYKEIFS